MKRKNIQADIPLVTRRRLFAALAAGPFAAAYGYGGILKAMDILLGSETAYAAPTLAPVKYFIEINLRDQWDFMHFAVPPGLATANNLVRATSGAKGEERLCGLFQDPRTLIKGPNNFYLTNDSKDILPHLDNIAMLETIEICIGSIHGHEGANGMRSPGRSYSKGAGKKAMWLGDDPNQTDFGGDEAFYSSSPTPGMVHLNLSKITNPSARAVALKFLGRSDKKHTVYHFGGDLSENGFLRVQSRDRLIQEFTQARPVDPLSKDEIGLLGSIVKRLDADYMNRLKYNAEASKHHSEAQVSFLQRTAEGAQILDLNLTAEEKSYWSSNVPPEMSGSPRMHLWEQCAMTSKLISANAVSGVAMEFGFDDLHGPRPKEAVVAQGKIIGMCLSRLIADLKANDLWNDTLIFMNTLDGGRSPLVDSYGDSGKNSMVLMGGRIQGGYYGDLRVNSTNGNVHTYSYHVPDAATGQTKAQGSTNNSGRIANAVAYRTILEAMGAGSAWYKNLPDVKEGEFLNFMLKKA